MVRKEIASLDRGSICKNIFNRILQCGIQSQYKFRKRIVSFLQPLYNKQRSFFLLNGLMTFIIVFIIDDYDHLHISDSSEEGESPERAINIFLIML